MSSGKTDLNLRIERVKKEDFPQLTELYLRAYRGLEEYAYTHPEDVRSYLEWLHRRDPEGFMVARADGRIVGFVAGDANWFSRREGKRVGAIHEIVVDPEYQGMGVGKKLMERILNYFREKGLDTAELWVGDENRKALNFYKKFGFFENGRYNYWIRMTRRL
ncbi:MAG: GNAT family N-acetyltransferase [Aquificae bacterium]|nr:GNAT family N-acetyltransferase [Aquificota bacterium]